MENNEKWYDYLKYEFQDMEELLYSLMMAEFEYLQIKKELRNQEDEKWFDKNFLDEICKSLDKKKASEKDKEHGINKFLVDNISELNFKEVQYHHLKRLYETALKFGFETIKG